MLRILKAAIGLIVLTGVAAYFLGGFVAGMFWCSGCNGVYGNTFGRFFIGLVFFFLSALSGGFPSQNEAGVGPTFNAWPFIFGCWAILFVVSLAYVTVARAIRPSVTLANEHSDSGPSVMPILESTESEFRNEEFDSR